MIELSTKMVMSPQFFALMIFLFSITAVFMTFALGMAIAQDTVGAKIMSFIGVGILAIAIICRVAAPRNIKEVHCIFVETVDMTEIQSNYKFISCDENGVFTLQEKNDDNK